MNPIVKPDGVYVMALCPGFTHTDFHNSPQLTAMKKASPNFLWYDADVVIREGLQRTGKRQGGLHERPHLPFPRADTELAFWRRVDQGNERQARPDG